MPLDILVKNETVVLRFTRKYETWLHRFIAIWKHDPLYEFNMTREQVMELRKHLLEAANRLRHKAKHRCTTINH